MTALDQNLCYNNACYKGMALYKEDDALLEHSAILLTCI